VDDGNENEGFVEASVLVLTGVVWHSLWLVGACQDTYLRNSCSLKDVHNVDEFLDWQFFVRADDHSRIRFLSVQADQTRFQRSRVNDFVVQSQNVVLIDRDRLNLRSID
jgi:hypothetical protein